MDKSVFLELVSSLSNDAINDYFRDEYNSIMVEVTRLDMISNDVIERVLKLANKEQDISAVHIKMLDDTVKVVSATLQEVESIDKDILAASK
ncbi:hypothetical protein EBU91_03685 [bacterium]|nr:hypothetical protein [bacterium]